MWFGPYGMLDLLHSGVLRGAAALPKPPPHPEHTQVVPERENPLRTFRCAQS